MEKSKQKLNKVVHNLLVININNNQFAGKCYEQTDMLKCVCT